MTPARLAELRALCDATRYQSGGRSGWIKENALSEALDEIERLRGIASRLVEYEHEPEKWCHSAPYEDACEFCKAVRDCEAALADDSEKEEA